MFPFPMSGPPGPTSTILKPQDVFAIIYEGSATVQAAINALPFTPDLLIAKNCVTNSDWRWITPQTRPNLYTASNSPQSEQSYSGWDAGTWVVYAFKINSAFYSRSSHNGNGQNPRAIPHGLVDQPQKIFTKGLSAISNWAAYLSDATVGANREVFLNSAAAATSPQTSWGASYPTVTDFNVSASNATNNNNGGLYYSHCFAYGDRGADTIIYHRGFNPTASGTASFSMPWKAQFMLLRHENDDGGDWIVLDMRRGWSNTANVLALNLPGPQQGKAMGAGPFSDRVELSGLSTTGLYVSMFIREAY